MNKGTQATHRGDLSEAKSQFQRAVTLAPSIAATHAALGSVLLQLNETSAAVNELQTAHRLAPQDTRVDLALAMAQVSARQLSSATQLFREALTGKGGDALDAQDCIAFAAALSAAHEDESAESALRDTITAIGPSPALSDALGTLVAKRGSFREALPLFQNAVARQPTFAQAQAHLGSTLLALGEPAQAVGPLRTAVAADPNNFAAQLDLGRALTAEHNENQALQALRNATRLLVPDTPREAVYMLALALQASGDPGSALPLFERVEAEYAGNREFLINYALAQVQTGNAKAAVPLYARALATGPDTATLRQDYGVAYLQEADLDHAIEQFREGLVLSPDDASLHYDLALAYKLKDQLPAAITELQRAAQLDSSLPDPSYTLGILYMQQGRFEDAAAQFRRTITLQPDNGDAWSLLGSVLKDAGNTTEAIAALNRAIQLQPEQPSLHIQLATLKLQAGDKESAAAERKIAADLSRAAVVRQRVSFALNSARSLLQQGKVDQALAQVSIALQADPAAAEPHSLLAMIYDQMGKAADAAVERQKAAQLNAAPSTSAQQKQ